MARPLYVPLYVVAALWFIIDALFWAVYHSSLKPFLRWLAQRVPLARIVARISAWITVQLDRLGPYPTLLVMLIPLALLEPAKPVGLWLIANGRWWSGLAVMGVAELIKILLIERLFRRSLPKLLTINWFAGGYGRVMALFAWLRRKPVWRWLLLTSHRLRRSLRRMIRAIWRGLRRSLHRIRMAFDQRAS